MTDPILPLSLHAFDSADIAAVYKTIAMRRDMRHFLPDPVDPALLQRLLALQICLSMNDIDIVEGR